MSLLSPAASSNEGRDEKSAAEDELFDDALDRLVIGGHADTIRQSGS